MKLYVLFFMLVMSSVTYSEDSIEAFSKSLSGAFKQGDIEKIHSLYNWDEAHFVFKDLEMMKWKDFIKDTKKDGFVYSNLKWVPLKDFDSWSLRAIEKWSINGNTYETNFPTVGAFEVTFVNKLDEFESYSEFLYVGKNKEAKFVGICMSVTKGGSVEKESADKSATTPESKSPDSKP